MANGVAQRFPATMLSGASLSNGANLGRAFQNVYVEIPALNSNTAINIHGSMDGTTYRQVYHPALNSSTVANNLYTILSSVTNALVPIPAGFKYYKVKTTATVDNGDTFYIVCGD